MENKPNAEKPVAGANGDLIGSELSISSLTTDKQASSNEVEEQPERIVEQKKDEFDNLGTSPISEDSTDAIPVRTSPLPENTPKSPLSVPENPPAKEVETEPVENAKPAKIENESVEDVEMKDVGAEPSGEVQFSEAVDIKEDTEPTQAESEERSKEMNQIDPFDNSVEPMEVDETDKVAEATDVQDDTNDVVEGQPEEPPKEVEDSFDVLRQPEESDDVQPVTDSSSKEADIVPEEPVEDDSAVEEIQVGENESIELLSEDQTQIDEMANFLSKITEADLEEPVARLDESLDPSDVSRSGERPPITEKEIREIEEEDTTETPCVHCSQSKIAGFAFLSNNELGHLCSTECVAAFKEAHPEVSYQVTLKRIRISLVLDTEQECLACAEMKNCKYKLKKRDEDELRYLCGSECLEKFTNSDWNEFTVDSSPFVVDNYSSQDEEEKQTCVKCVKDDVKCSYSGRRGDETVYICQEECLNALMKDQPDRFSVKQKNFRVKDLPNSAGISATIVPESEQMVLDGQEGLKKKIPRSELEANEAKAERDMTFVRECKNCQTSIEGLKDVLQWETLDFCSSNCLITYQRDLAKECESCGSSLDPNPGFGRFFIRFGTKVKAFCKSQCLAEFKDSHFVCGLCHKVKCAGEDFPLPGLDNEDRNPWFCSRKCAKEFKTVSDKSVMPLGACHVCNHNKEIGVHLKLDDRQFKLCSNACLSAFKFVNNVIADQCKFCDLYFERSKERCFTVYEDKATNEDGQPRDEEAIVFCTKVCKNLYLDKSRLQEQCFWCKVKKYNNDLIKLLPKVYVCSVGCHQMLKLVQETQKDAEDRYNCSGCQSNAQVQKYFLQLSDDSWRSFCRMSCAKTFQEDLEKEAEENGEEQEEGALKIVGSLKKFDKSIDFDSILGPFKPKPKPLSTRSFAQDYDDDDYLDSTPMHHSRSPSPIVSRPVGGSGRGRKPQKQIEVRTQVITVGPPPVLVSNCATMCKPRTESRGVNCRPKMASKECQTEPYLEQRFIIPIPVPIYVPTPMPMYSLPIPIPLPMAVPIPVPVFIPTTRNSAQGIMKEIRKIQDKMPTDPFEAELLLMAEMVADDKKKEASDSESDPEDTKPLIKYAQTINNNNHASSAHVEEYQQEVPMGDDMLMMALKMAYDEPAVDLESAMTANTITQAPTHMAEDHSMHDQIIHMPAQHIPHQQHLMLLEQQQGQPVARGRKRGSAVNRNSTPRGGGVIGGGAGVQANSRKRNQREVIIPAIPEPTQREMEKSESFMCLKYTFGVNAWKQWVLTKNTELQKSTLRRKPFKSDLLQLTADELNYSLSLFVKEVRKPNGSEYAPDTIYYLVLGIQQYLYENGRIDNIFTDVFYDNFTNCLDEVARKFSVLYNDSQYIVTRVEEEHLWECKQLGAHSPHVLLSTLMFFNTKHFNLTTVDEHMQLSFSHIMKHWKRNPNQPGGSKVPGSRNVLLRFYPPQSALDANSRKKKVYEQQENEENPLRCPVKLYEFYLSKCPESVKTRNDVFYLMPERSCVPDSPVWYSTQALGKDALSKMLHRVKMVKEINIALLTS